MILENQGHQHGYSSVKDSLRVKSDHLEMYFPQSENWRNFSKEQSHRVFGTLIPRFVGK